jgi:hypothetical protein
MELTGINRPHGHTRSQDHAFPNRYRNVRLPAVAGGNVRFCRGVSVMIIFKLPPAEKAEDVLARLDARLERQRKHKAKLARINRIVRENATPMWKIRARAHNRRKMLAEMKRNAKKETP